ncbi:MAG: 30S ribosomal protein S2 [DPANN group archaeon]|nr:30S ribosomal protein S2 [DPANN group archaeon]
MEDNTKNTSDESSTQDTLVPIQAYLSTGIHIGMKQRLKAMSKYIYKVRDDKLAVFNIQMIDDQLKNAAKMISKYDPKDILVTSRKKYGQKPAVMFAKAIGGANAVYGRFFPGSLTNQKYRKYMEPKLAMVTDPHLDKQVVKEAFNCNIPIIGICDTFNNPQYLDLVISSNNKGRKSLALVYWILAKEVLKLRGDIKGDAEFKYTVEDFEMPEEKIVRTEKTDSRNKQRR